jgi:dihydroorotate dehydrogenase electron transfer subunit
LRERERVSVIGPLGNAFELPRDGETALLVGGGVGIPPMLYLATKLKGGVAFVGALTRDLLPVTIVGNAVEEFKQYGLESVIATDDGSFGYRGFVTQALEKYLSSANTQVAVIYTCGPELMMKRVAAIAAERGIECQVAVERAMACGMGTCQSCCIKVRKADASKPPLAGSDWCYRLACTDGPIFRGADLLW